MLKRLGLCAALEDIANGAVSVEQEYVWYGILENPEELEKALSVESHSQSNMRAPKGQSRVRKTTVKGEESKYIITVKAHQSEDKLSSDEVSLPCSEDMWKCYRAASGESMDKIRYTFDAGDGLTWEVDVFTEADEVTPKRWVKIDLEVKEKLTVFPNLPITLSKVIFSPNKQYTEKDNKSLDTLYREVFVNRV